MRRPLFLDGIFVDLVDTPIVPDTVLPSTLRQIIIGETIRDPPINLWKRKTVVVCSEYIHGYERSVAIRRSIL